MKSNTMYAYTFKAPNGEIATVKACDADQAQILAAVRYGDQFLKADLIRVTNAL